MYYSVQQGNNQKSLMARRKGNVLTVNGEGTVSVEPNLALLTVGVITEQKSLQLAQSENSHASRNIIETLLAMGIRREDIKTIEYRIMNTYDFIEGKQVFRGFEVRHLFEVTVQQIQRVGEIVDAVVEAGANTIYHIRFDRSDSSELYNQALALALQDAQQKQMLWR